MYTFSYAGQPTAPSITAIRDRDGATVQVTLQPPEYGQECVLNYTVRDQVRGAMGVSNTTNVLVRVCPLEYNFTAVACSSVVPCSEESSPVVHQTAGGKQLLFYCAWY